MQRWGVAWARDGAQRWTWLLGGAGIGRSCCPPPGEAYWAWVIRLSGSGPCNIAWKDSGQSSHSIDGVKACDFKYKALDAVNQSEKGPAGSGMKDGVASENRSMDGTLSWPTRPRCGTRNLTLP